MSTKRKDLVNEESQWSLFDLAKETVQQDIPANANVKSDYHSFEATNVMRRLSQTCRMQHHFFRPELDKRDAKQLLQYVLYGDEEKVIKVAQSNPRLFFIKTTAEDYAMDLEGNKRLIQEWSPYQAMFGTSDIVMLACVKPALDNYLKNLQTFPKGYENLRDGFEMAAEQEKEKFPNGFDFPSCTDQFNQLVNDLEVGISNDHQLRQDWKNPGAATLALVQKFKEHLKPSIVQAGHHFNMNDAIKMHSIFTKNANHRLWTEHQLAFFALNIIAPQQRMMTAPYLQAACTGIEDFSIIKPLQRNFELMNYITNTKTRLVPFTCEDPSCRLGSGFVVDRNYCSSEKAGCVGGLEAKRAGLWAGVLNHDVKQTQRDFQNLCACQRNKLPYVA